MYETELLEQFADTAAAKEFFSCLDFQLNKVNQFFKTKETEFMELGESLKKQLEILIDLKTAIQHRRQTRDITPDSKEDGSISYTISCGNSSTCLVSNATKSFGCQVPEKIM